MVKANTVNNDVNVKNPQNLGCKTEKLQLSKKLSNPVILNLHWEYQYELMIYFLLKENLISTDKA